MAAAHADEVASVEAVTDLTNSDVVTKYRAAADIANEALNGVISQVKAGKSVVELCAFGDTIVNTLVGKDFKKVADKGIAFPTCVSVNNVVCHFSPMTDEDRVLADGDSVKIDLGAHIDGFMAIVAHTLVVGEDGPAAGDITGPQADVMAAAYSAAELAVRMIKPGNKNTDITAMITRVAEAYGVQAVQGALMHQMKQYIIDGNKVILQRADPEQKVEEETFEEAEVYGIDVAFSSGEGKPRQTGARTTVFKRAAEAAYSLKMKASRWFMKEMNTKAPFAPFCLRGLGDEKQARMGVVECMKHELVHDYPVLEEKEGDHVAHVKFTVLLLPGGTFKVTGLELPANVKSEKSLPEDLAELLAQPSYKPTKGRRRKKKKAGAGGSA